MVYEGGRIVNISPSGGILIAVDDNVNLGKNEPKDALRPLGLNNDRRYASEGKGANYE